MYMKRNVFLLLLQISGVVIRRYLDVQPSCKMLYLLSPRHCFFIVFNLDLLVNREDSLMS